MNDGIEKELCSLRYSSVEKAVRQIIQLGPGTLMAKKSTYRIVPVHPEDRHLLGMRWRDEVYVDTVLPFGLRSAPKIFNAFADALMWIGRSHRIEDLDHYLDDFFLGPLGSSEYERCLRLILSLFARLGLASGCSQDRRSSNNYHLPGPFVGQRGRGTLVT